jgi:hypothetical protein
MSLKGMAYIERGHIEDPHFSSLHSIARALDMSVGELVGDPVAPKALAPSPPEEVDEERRALIVHTFRLCARLLESSERLLRTASSMNPEDAERMAERLWNTVHGELGRYIVEGVPPEVERWIDAIDASLATLGGEVQRLYREAERSARNLADRDDLVRRRKAWAAKEDSHRLRKAA